MAQARALAEAALDIYRELGDVRGEAHGLDTLGTITCLMDDYEAGRPLVLDSLRLYRELGDTQGIAQALLDLGTTADSRDRVRTPVYLQECLALFRERGDMIGIGYTLSELGRAAIWQGDFEQAEHWLEESRRAQNSIGGRDPMILQYLGVLALRRGDYAEARTYFEQGLAVCQEAGSTVLGFWSMVHLGYAYLSEGEEDCAQETFAEVQQRFREMGSKIGVVYALEGFASLAVRQQEWARAVRLYAWADGVRATIGDQRPPVEQRGVDRDYTAIRAQMSDLAIAAATLEGRAMTMEQAIAFAREAHEQRTV
jgi:tetratricopeptide (TPR) repeat protein